MRLRRVLPTLLAALALWACNPKLEPSCDIEQGLAVFPGAEGFGTRTPAGRGGQVLEVTTLADSGPGSLREAVATPGPRVVVFRVGGTITLASELDIHEPFLTIAGQTAPGDGILIRGAGLTIFAHDVLIQHLRVRSGSDGSIDPSVNDAIAIMGAHGDVSPGASNVVLDHVSTGWSEDEIISVWYGAHHVTLSWSMLSEALDRARHPKERHSAGLLLGDGASCVSIHHNLLAHNDFRNPLIKDGGRHDVVNNVVYDWGTLGTELIPVDRVAEVNLVGNAYLPGPSSTEAIKEVVIAGGHPVHHLVDAEQLLSPAGRVRLFAQGNTGPNRAGDDAAELALVSDGYGLTGAPEGVGASTRFEAPLVTTSTAAVAVDAVLAGAGATLPRRDAIDARVVGQVRAGTGTIIDSPDEVGGYPEMLGGDPPADTDQDGMPDVWEQERGLDPDDPTDGRRDDDGDGYTNLEAWLHSLTAAGSH